MTIFLYGTDGYRLNKKADFIIQEYKKKHSSGVNLFSFDLETDSISKTEDVIKTVSFFNEVKLLVLKNTFLTKQSADNVLELIQRYDLANSKETVLLLKENLDEKALISKNRELFYLLSSSKNLVTNFKNLEGKKLEDWVKKEFFARHCTIAPLLVQKLVYLVSKDTTRLACEIDKLSNFKVKEEISSVDIDKLVSQNIEPNIFEFLGAITVRNKPRALGLLYKELKSGRDPYYLLTMIIYQFRNLLIVKDLVSRNFNLQLIHQRTKIHPFIIRKLTTNNDYTCAEARFHFNYLAQIDCLIKMGKADLEDCLYNFVLI